MVALGLPNEATEGSLPQNFDSLVKRFGELASLEQKAFGHPNSGATAEL